VIKFKKIRWKNFLSTGNIYSEMQLDKTETTLVLGENGAGKSTLLDALCFVLFNKPYRSVNLPQLVSSVNEKDCVVEIHFTDGSKDYKVIRGQSPKVFEIWSDGKLIDQDSKARDYQRMLEDTILGMNYKSFCQVVILGSANYIPFMRLPAAERRSVVESILDIGVFSTMNTQLKERISTNKEELQHAESAVSVSRERVSLLRRMVEEEKKRQEHDDAWEAEQVAKANEEIRILREQSAECSKEMSQLMDSIKDEDAARNTRNRFREIHSQLTKRVSNLGKEIAFYESNDTCPTCTQRIDQEFKGSAVAKAKSRTDEMTKALSEVEGHIASTEERLEEISEVLSRVRVLNTEIMRKNNEISAVERQIGSIGRKPTVESTVEKDLSDALVSEEEALDGKRELVEEQHYLSLAATLLKDSGIKSRIIKNYIPVINDTINKYLTKMNFFVAFNLDEEFNETIKSRHRDEFTYASFSEGEKKKIDLALLFAWRRIAAMKNSITTNLLILDEILDGSLDDQGTDAFLDIVGGLDKDTNTFVISHKPKEILQDKFDRTVQFVKRGNFSRMA
jgi:DNA repair exonuclease SbcCD ATPase subunit